MKRKAHSTSQSVAAFLVLMAAISCSSPVDESWLRITSFSQEDATISVLNSDLATIEDDSVDIGVTNLSTSPQDTLPGAGISIEHVQVNYRYEGTASAFPEYDYPVRYYLLPRDTETGPEEAFIADIPIVPIDLKQWLLDPLHIPATVSCCRFTIQAEITISGRTDEGRELSTTGILTIVFN